MAKIRYLVGDVDRSIEFYTQQLGFKLEHHAGPAPLRASQGGISLSCSADRGAPGLVPYRMDDSNNRVDGIDFSSTLRICHLASPR